MGDSPAQIPPITEEFTPTAAAVAQAERILETLSLAAQNGSGAARLGERCWTKPLQRKRAAPWLGPERSEVAGVIEVGGPFFDELRVGQVYDTAPPMTLTSGAAATHQSIVGGRLRLPLNQHLSRAVTGRPAAMAAPGLVWDVAIGQSTLATHHIKANLSYRGLRFHRFPHVDDTIATRTEVVGLRDTSVKPGRRPTGLVALRMETTDQNGLKILDFYRCAMIPLSDSPGAGRQSATDNRAAFDSVKQSSLQVPAGWDLTELASSAPPPTPGTIFQCGTDVVSNAPELARFTLNIAAVHHDYRSSGERLVYDGHVIGLALAQATRALPNLVTLLGWQSCDHLAPVREGNTLVSRLELLAVDVLSDGWLIVELRSVASVVTPQEMTPVLDWRFAALAA
jgi:acyl dehydratase